MNRDRADLGPEVPLQVGRGHRREDRAFAFARQDGAPLQVARLRARDRRAACGAVRGRPRAPRVVRRFGIAGAREHLDLTARGCRPVPAQRSPGRRRLRVAGFGLVRAARGPLGREAEELPRIRRGVIETAARILVEAGDLLGARARQQRRAERIAFEAEHLSLVAGSNHQRTARVEREIVGRVVAGFPQLIPCAIGRNLTHGAFRRSPIVPRRGRRRRARGDVDHRDRCDLGRHRGHAASTPDLLAAGHDAPVVEEEGPPDGRPLRAAAYSAPLSSKRIARISWKGESSRTKALPAGSTRSTLPGDSVPTIRLPDLSTPSEVACVAFVR